MKILELRFKNLNSLYGEWVIDFTHAEYDANGIFALTGPTGAGKSTILDAICLALYGSTPRLGKITSSGNEIMSRQTGECYAEVLFESQTGKYRCHWEQRRARKMADGKLQNQEHQISDVDTGKPIETKKSLVIGVIEEKTGMDFDRFTRSILLAQGGFDTFLKANVEQKSKILEQITGTEIYTEISLRVHERQRDERDKLNVLRAETSGIVILEPEHEKQIEEELVSKQDEEKKLAKKSTQINEAITWLANIEALQNEIVSLKENETELKTKLDEFTPKRHQLELALNAASLDGVYASLTSLRKQQSDDQATLKTDEAALPELESTANSQTDALNAAEQLTLKAKEEFSTAAPLIQKIRLLDQRIEELTKAVSTETDACTKQVEKIETENQKRDDELKKQSDADKTLAATELYLKNNKADEWLVGNLAGVEEQFTNLLAKQQEITLKETALSKASTDKKDAADKHDKAIKRRKEKEEEVKSARENLQQAKEALSNLLGDKLLREYRTEKETLLREMAFIKRIEELEDHRAKLEDGKPCPLCGSNVHPFAEGNVPVPDETEKKIETLTSLIDEAERQEEVIKELEQAEISVQNHLNTAERLETDAANAKKVAEKAFDDLKDTLEELQASFDAYKLAVSEKLKPLGIIEIPESEIETLLESLRTRSKAWKEQVEQKTEIEKRIADINSELKRLDAVIEEQINTLNENQEKLERLNNELTQGKEERKQLYGDKIPNQEEERLNKAILKAEHDEREARDRSTESHQKLTTAKSQIETLKNRLKQRTDELKKSEAAFSNDLIQAGFADEKSFLEARLSKEERESLSKRVKELDDAKTELNVKKNDREKRLATELDKKLSEKTLEELEPQFDEYQHRLKDIRDSIAGLNHQLAENKTAKERVKEKQSAIEAQKKECHRWEKLNHLIGSSDGKKYRNFAQGLTFELMVSHANQQLQKMTDRYLLIRDEKEPLELNVVDNYQAGEIRSTKNLSGGETFIISLTLALGLSKMASRKVRVDSLFLDEGFGTLDEDALETALETLSGLQQDGKIIGIISHVQALKERIPTQITVSPTSGGRSVISGPGCAKM